MPHYRWTTPAVLLALTVALSGCGERAERADSGGAADDPGPTLTQCRDILVQDAFTALGWEALGDVALDDNNLTCSGTGSGGELTLAREPVPAGSIQELPAAADAAFEKRCAKLGGYAEEPAGALVDWLGEVPACAWMPEGATSHVLVVRWSDEVVTEARVVPTEDVAPAAAREALVALSRAADTAL